VARARGSNGWRSRVDDSTRGRRRNRSRPATSGKRDTSRGESIAGAPKRDQVRARGEAKSALGPIRAEMEAIRKSLAMIERRLARGRGARRGRPRDLGLAKEVEAGGPGSRPS